VTELTNTDQHAVKFKTSLIVWTTAGPAGW